MGYETEKILPEKWGVLGELAHQVCFSEVRPQSMSKHHFVIAAFKNNEIAGYMTCLETDSETVYLQHGGAFPDHAKSVGVLSGYRSMLSGLSKDYERAWTRIENKNLPMLKMALHVGFLVQGVYHHNGKTFVELNLEFKGED